MLRFKQKGFLFFVLFLFNFVCVSAQEYKPSPEYLKEKRDAKMMRFCRNTLPVAGGIVLYYIVQDKDCDLLNADWWTIGAWAYAFACASLSLICHVGAKKAERDAEKIRIAEIARIKNAKKKQESLFSSLFKRKKSSG